MTKYLIENIAGKRKRVWSSGRNRGLDQLAERIGDIIPYINRLLTLKQTIRVLEVGCGYGRALLELRKNYGERIQTYGINYESDWNRNLVRMFGLDQKLFTIREIGKNLPHISIADAGKRVPYPNNYFDFIFSQATVQYIADKAHFLEEINRVLTKEGTAVIELQECKSKHALEYRNLFEIWNEGKLVPSIYWLRKFKSLQIKKGWREWHTLLLKKSKRLDLGLKMINFFDLKQINKNYTGTKSIYVVK